MTVKMTSSLPDKERNGLAAIADELVKAPGDLHVVIAIVDCKKVTTDHDTGDVVPTARIRRVEVVDHAEDGRRLQQLMQRSFERRTGQTVLPIDLEDELRTAFGDEEDEGDR